MSSFSQEYETAQFVEEVAKQKPSRLKHRLVKGTLLTLVFVVSGVAIVISVFTIRDMQSLKDDMSSRSGFCIICSELYPEGYFDRDAETLVASLDRHTDDGVQICCAKNLDERSDMMKLQLRRRDSLTYPRISNKSVKDYDPSNMNFGSISAHKVLTVQGLNDGPEPAFEERFYQLHLMQTNDPRYEHVNGVKVIPSGLQVEYPGLYFVYKSIHFVPDTYHPCRKLKQQTFHSVLLRNTTRRVSNIDVLLRSEHTCCPDCSRHRETAFTGGIFYLDRGDLIQVEISAYGLVYFKQDVTYLGITMVNGNVDKNSLT